MDWENMDEGKKAFILRMAQCYEELDEKQKMKEWRKEVKRDAEKAVFEAVGYHQGLYTRMEQGIFAVIQCKLGLTRIDCIKREDVPKAKEIAKQVLALVSA